MAFNNNGETKSKAVKAAGRKSKATAPFKPKDGLNRASKSAGKKTDTKKSAARGSASHSEDLTQSLAAKKKVKAAKKAPAKGVAARKRKLSRAVPADAGMELAPGVDPFEVAKQTMKGSVPEIVKVMVKRAKQGSCSHAKTLLEMTGAKHMFGEEPETQNSGEPWAKLILERMERAEQESLQQAPQEVGAEL